MSVYLCMCVCVCLCVNEAHVLALFLFFFLFFWFVLICFLLCSHAAKRTTIKNRKPRLTQSLGKSPVLPAWPKLPRTLTLNLFLPWCVNAVLLHHHFRCFFFFLIVLFVVLPCNNCLSSLNIPSTVLFVLSLFPCFNFLWGGALCDRVTTFTLTAFKVTRTTFASAPHLKTCTPATACRSRFMSWPATTTIVEMSLRRSSTQSTQLDGPCPTRTTHGASPLTTATVATPPLIS